ncbi:hypothetical protein BCR35DRAFT_333614 [Leucosporidium creatinivorum]|uniref:DUF6534 domain-containing protein n=1 Tax=Leucosporidium creatinivorum TaxID=106004 RepID=A0A1Y2EQ10_9BASI|nr:hypothetical protein BCR35DRAFT_333614 [Leucosporidium creatinivorum]
MVSPIEQLLGSFFVGTILSVFLEGVVASLGLSYFLDQYRTDRLAHRLLVYTMLAVDLFHTATSSATVYHFCVSEWGVPTAHIYCPWTFWIEVVTTGFATTLCQTFYSYRIYVVGGRRPLIPSAIMFLSLLQLGFSVAGSVGIKVGLNQEFARFHERTYGVMVWLLSAAFADILITGSLVYYLTTGTSGLHRRNAMLATRIIRNTIETNGLTLSFAILDAILFITMQNSLWHVIPNLCLVKLYTMSALVSLNSRTRLSKTPMSGLESHCRVVLRPPAPSATKARPQGFSHRRTESLASVSFELHIRGSPQDDELMENPPPSASSNGSLSTLVTYYPHSDTIPLTCVPSRRHAVPPAWE